VLYPTQSDTPAGNDLAIGGTTITAAPFAVDVSANTIYIGDGATAGSTSVIFKSNGATDTGTLLYNTSDKFQFSGGNIAVDQTVELSASANQGINGGGLVDCDDPTNSKLLWDSTTNKFGCGTDGGAGSGTSKWTTGVNATYLTTGTANISVGTGTDSLTAPFSVTVASNLVRIGDGADDTNTPTITMYASDATDSGSILFTDNDQFNFAGADVLLDQDLLLTSATPSITLTDSDASSDDYSVNVNANVLTLINDTDGRTELSFVGDGIDFI
jgi:hypothetical protein